jgi:acetylornithine/succinyldiaminopimelate/putrescine aminotransferase
MVCLAKGISNGTAAIGTVVGKSNIFEPAFDEAMLISTFGWTPVACAAALKTLQIHERDKTWEIAEKKGRYIKECLAPFIGDKIISIDGMGMEIGVRFKDAETCKAVQQKAFADGLNVVVGSQENMQIMPPLTIPQELLDKGIEIITGSIES